MHTCRLGSTCKNIRKALQSYPHEVKFSKIFEAVEVADLYNKIGANGLLRYVALVASSVDEKKISNFSMNLDGCQMVEIFLKNILANKYFDGIMCRDFAEQDSFDGITLIDSTVT